jgi:hypothetical protein
MPEDVDGASVGQQNFALRLSFRRARIGVFADAVLERQIRDRER